METEKERIQKAFERAGLPLDLGKGWTPIERVVKAWRELNKEGIEEEED